MAIEWCGPSQSPAPKEKPEKVDGFGDRKRVFEAWKVAFKKKRGSYRSGDKRDMAVSARMKSFKAEDLIRSVEGYAMDPWRHGQLNRHELATLMRSDGQVEAGLEIHDNGGAHGRHGAGSGNSGRARGNSTVDFIRGGGGGGDDKSVPQQPSKRREVQRRDPMGVEELF